MDTKAWWATVLWLAKSSPQVNVCTVHTHPPQGLVFTSKSEKLFKNQAEFRTEALLCAAEPNIPRSWVCADWPGSVESPLWRQAWASQHLRHLWWHSVASVSTNMFAGLNWNVIGAALEIVLHSLRFPELKWLLFPSSRGGIVNRLSLWSLVDCTLKSDPFNKCLLSACSLPGSAPHTWDSLGDKWVFYFGSSIPGNDNLHY